MKNSKSTKNLKREIKCQRELNHPNILKLDHFFEDDDQIYLILELAEKGSLFRYLKNNNQLSEPLTFYFFFQITLAIDYMHKNNIIHRDIKVSITFLKNSTSIFKLI